MSNVTVWLLHKSKVVLVDDGPGVPVEATLLHPDTVDPQNPTVSEVLIRKDDYKTFNSWKMASRWARRKAKEIGYEVDYSSNYPYGD